MYCAIRNNDAEQSNKQTNLETHHIGCLVVRGGIESTFRSGGKQHRNSVDATGIRISFDVGQEGRFTPPIGQARPVMSARCDETLQVDHLFELLVDGSHTFLCHCQGYLRSGKDHLPHLKSDLDFSERRS